MCGIVGVIGPDSENKSLTESLSALAFRGPDRQASIRCGPALLGHSRLSIIDTSHKADQPMQDPTGRYTLVFNGEIYNYRTIAESLKEDGLELRSNSDTEVLLHLLIKKGLKALEELNGFFAFTFYDSEEDHTIIARDRLGIKPLYYSISANSLFFSSEMKGLTPLLGRTVIDETALHFLFRFNYLPEGISIFTGINRLGPGQYIERIANKVEIDQYYTIHGEKESNSLYTLLDDAVKIRLAADVPLGSFLSGGVDSSIIAALAAGHRPGLKTFSIGFKDNAHFDESVHAEKVARHINSDHRTIQLDEDEMLDHVSGLLDYMDEPFADSSAIAVHALSHYTRKEVTVALSGDGADELFGGYTKHQAHIAALAPTAKEKLASTIGSMSKGIKGGHSSKVGNLVRQAKLFNHGKSMNALDRYWTWATWTEKDFVSSLLNSSPDGRYNDILHRSGPQDSSLEEVLLADTRGVLPSDMLTKVDRMSMANSLEVRVPFLDHRVVEHAHSLRADQRFKKGEGKYILKEHFGHLIPKEIFDRKKKGFEVPLEAWFLGPLRSQLQKTLSDGLLVNSGLFYSSKLKELEQRLEKNKISQHVHLLWALMVFHRFYSRFGH